eukprot:5680398-Prymnesium_polylepis.1
MRGQALRTVHPRRRRAALLLRHGAPIAASHRGASRHAPTPSKPPSHPHAAQVFIIREVNFTDSANFLGSASVHSVALSKGWWRPSDGLIDFTRVYSDGE